MPCPTTSRKVRSSRVKVLETDEKGRVRLSMKALLNEKAE